MEEIGVKIISIKKYGFEVWCFQVKALLESINAWGIVEGAELRPADNVSGLQKDFDLRSGKAKRILISSLEPAELKNILNCDTPKRIFDKLCSLYQQKDETQLQFLMQKFFKLEFSCNMKDFLADVESLLAQIKAQGEDISETMIINKIISSLPEAYSNFSTAWESTAANERNLNNLTSRLLKEEIKLNEKNGLNVSNNSAFRSSLQCYKCKGDHKIKDCPGMRNTKCFACNKFGHMSKYCRSKMKFNRQQQHKDGGGRNRVDGNASHADLSPIIFNCQVVERECNAVDAQEWYRFILDSGASNHMVNENWFNYMNNIRQLQQHAKISVAKKGEHLISKSQGDVLLNTESGPIYLTEVLMVPGLEKNLISIRELTRKNYNVNFYGDMVEIRNNENGAQRQRLKSTKHQPSYGIMKKPDLNKLHPFGTVAYVNIPRQIRKGKFEARSEKMKLVGYTTNGFRFYDEINEKAKIKDAVNEGTDDNENEEVENSVNIDNEIEEMGADDGVENNNQSGERRKRKAPKYLSDYEVYNTAMFAYTTILHDVPSTFEEAYQDKEWKKSIEEEVAEINKKHTWTIVKDEGQPRIDGIWVFNVKKNCDDTVRRKARLVARGCKQRYGSFGDVYAPVANSVTVRSFISMALHKNFNIHQLDVKCAFLNGELREDVFMTVPPPFEGKLCKLNRSIYGLKQSALCWNNEFNKKILKIGFVRSENDYCLYKRKSLFLLLYVDDILLCGGDSSEIETVKNYLKEQFEIKDLGEVKEFLGIQIVKLENGDLKLAQTNNIINLLKRFGFENSKYKETPIERNWNSEKEDYSCVEWNQHTYRQAIGGLLYISIWTRPDIAYAVNTLSRHQEVFGNVHINAVKRIFRYLNATKSEGLIYSKIKQGSSLCGYSDASWGEAEDRKSTTGYCFKSFGNLLSWRATKQKTISLSSTEAEYVALSTAAQEGVWLKRLLNEYEVSSKDEIFDMYVDNQGAKCIAEQLETRRSKHIELKYHFIRQQVQDGKIKLKYIQTDCQLADIFTKPLAKNKFCLFKNLLNIKD
ncbi:Copia protein [Eumeta japonica]|uniref:Copia protein n=1 Tax=Eumeta variegata TaxID=151549 RepID=A0A4C1T9G5_EUMVA|nr:Copia protein [Eumeta japonica]